MTKASNIITLLWIMSELSVCVCVCVCVCECEGEVWQATTSIHYVCVFEGL